LSVVGALLSMAKGLYVWIDVPSCSIPLVGKVETFDDEFVMLSCAKGLFCVSIADIASVHLANQVEIVAPDQSCL
jgi:hypothetical protein